MKELHLEGLNPVVSNRMAPFIGEILESRNGNIHSIHIVGSSITADFDEKSSDINSVIVLKKMDLGFVEFLAPLGKKYSKKGIAAPLIMTPEYIQESLDVFPIEFLDIKNIHKTVYGEDIFGELEINRPHLRLQCEREIKTKLIGLRQGYISSLGDKKILTERLSLSITGYMPLFRAIIYLLGKEPPIPKHDVVAALQKMTGTETAVFESMLLLKRKKIVLSKEDLGSSFEQYYSATEGIGKIVDELQA
ncbi:MAG TPA: hypothetical protein DHV16_11380 [Nitrospiraceae bacterium]|nr:MAG: hypothetical protein A2Z82_06340 [Nitrospirae bacterium GWA2_46_11]HCZ12820.1 hypothetical protein [Nitrospiraceae bacterium]